MRPAPLVAVGLVCAALTAAAAQDAPRRKSEAQGRTQYFLDFRARGGGFIGHTFIVYGRMDARGRVLEAHHAGLNPRRAYAGSPMLALALVPGEITFKKEDPRMPTRAVYRRRLNAAQYAHLQATVRRLRATQHSWHMAFNNCNDFAAQVAREMGLWSPFTWAMPTTFVHSLRAMNGR